MRSPCTHVTWRLCAVAALVLLVKTCVLPAARITRAENPEVLWLPVYCYDNGDRIWDSKHRYIPIRYTVEYDGVPQPPFELMKYDNTWRGHWEQPCLGGTCVWETMAWDYPSFTIPPTDRGRPHALRIMAATDNMAVSAWSTAITWYPDGWQPGRKRLMPPVINNIR